MNDKVYIVNEIVGGEVTGTNGVFSTAELAAAYAARFAVQSPAGMHVYIECWNVDGNKDRGED